MIYVWYILLIAAMFGLVALADFLLQKFFPKPDVMRKGKVVRMPRYSFILGLLVTFFAIVGLLYLPFEEKLLWWGCWLVLAMGAYLLTNFWRFGIFYDDEGFVYRTLTQKVKTYRYADITAQRSFLAKSGVNTTLYAAGEEIPLYSAMQGLGDFLHFAFYRWCEETGTDPESVENNPAMLHFFPELKQ